MARGRLIASESFAFGEVIMTRIFNLGGLPLITALAILIGLSGSKPAQAAPWPVCEIRNVRTAGQLTQPATSVWGYSNNLPGGILTFSQTLTVSNSVSLGVGVTAPMATASLGFDVTWSKANLYQYQTGPIPRGKRVQIQAFFVYQGYTCDIWMTPAFAAPNRAQKVGSGTALKSIGVRCVVTVTP